MKNKRGGDASETEVPTAVVELIDRFGQNEDAYLSPTYNETQLRREFIDPMFEALGWDVTNRQGWAEPYKEVIHEDAIRVGGVSKAPDYAFRVGGTRKFFVETKKPSTNLKASPEPALQLRRYAWSAKLPVSILTDFQELAVYDTRIRPKKDDRPAKGRVLYVTYQDYTSRWSEIASIFSKEAVLRGSFDRYVLSTRRKRGTAEVDEAFLEDMEGWRGDLARHLALRNPGLSVRELNLSVQRILDRIIFLRIAEDRGIEEYAQLLGSTNGENLYQRLQVLFSRADERYNSGLFYFRREKGREEAPDTLTPSLAVDDGVVRDLIRGLYYPQCPYEFSVIPADILGQVYERFLGKTIRLTPKHRAVVEEKPEIRKQGGVYYTPSYIVDEIVEQVLTPLVQGKRPGPRGGVSRLRIVDPACGSGSFLLACYQFLLNWHLQQYLNDGVERHQKRVVRGRTGEWKLTTEERKRILLNNIFGVDIDPQAVEVTKLSLLLKVLEGETDETIARQLTMFRRRALPDLARNIRCGNSLITPEFFEQCQIEDMGVEERIDINAFEWKEGFPEVLKSGGFDAVIGNPPYVLLQTLDRPDIFAYLKTRYESAKYKIDTYHVFMEMGIKLLREQGYLGFITPVSFLRNKHARALREMILSRTEVQMLHLFDSPVFHGASVDTAITIARREKNPQGRAEAEVRRTTLSGENTKVGTVRHAEWLRHPERHLAPMGSEGEAALADRIESEGTPLGAFADAYFGIQTHSRAKYVTASPDGEDVRPVIDGKHIEPFVIHEGSEWVEFRPEAIKSGGRKVVYEQDRIVVRQIGAAPIAALAPGGLYTLNTIYNVYWTKDTQYTLRFVLGALLCSVGQWYWKMRFFDQKRTFPKIKKRALLAFPLPPVDSTAIDDIDRRVAKLLKLYQDAGSAKVEIERQQASRQIQYEKSKLDEAFMCLYGLTEKEAALLQTASNEDDDERDFG